MKKSHTELLKKGIETGAFERYLYKYRDFGEFTDKIIEKSEFYFAPPKSFNDPFDCNLSYKQSYSKKEIQEHFDRFITRNTTATKRSLKKYFGGNARTYAKKCNELNNKLLDSAGILSLSTDNQNITMWSHYANNHKGLAFELDVTEDYDFFSLYGVVEYTDNYEILSYAKDNRDELSKLFLTKFTDWTYEKEVRIIDYEKNGVRKFNPLALKTIYFGCKASSTNINHVKKLCKINGFGHVKFKKAEMVEGEFKVCFSNV